MLFLLMLTLDTEEEVSFSLLPSKDMLALPFPHCSCHYYILRLTIIQFWINYQYMVSTFHRATFCGALFVAFHLWHAATFSSAQAAPDHKKYLFVMSLFSTFYGHLVHNNFFIYVSINDVNKLRKQKLYFHDWLIIG